VTDHEAVEAMVARHRFGKFAPATLNAGFAPHCRRSDTRWLTGQIDPS
jgi:uncharacterized protein with PIN domain